MIPGLALALACALALAPLSAGLAVIGLTQEAHPGEPPSYALAALIALECTVLGLATSLALISGRLGLQSAGQDMLLGAAAGALFGVSDVAPA